MPKRFASTCGLFAAAGGIVSLLGWVLDIPTFRDWYQVGITIKANASICTMAAGFAMLALVYAPQRVFLIRVLATLVAVVAGLTLLQHGTGVNLGIDTLLFMEPAGATATTAPGRMGVPASVSLTLVGVCLLLLTFGRVGRKYAACIGVLVVGIVAFSIVGYIYGASQLFAVARITAIALHTATMIAALGIGIVACAPEHGLMAVALRPDPGGLILRRLILPVTCLPILLGWVTLEGHRRGWYDVGFESAVLVLTLIGVLAGLLWWTASGISRATEVARHAHEALTMSEERLRLALSGARAGAWQWDLVTQELAWSPELYRLLGVDPGVKPDFGMFAELIHPQDRERLVEQFQQTLARGGKFEYEFRIHRSDGQEVWLSSVGRVEHDTDGKPLLAVGINQDITDRKHAEESLRQSESELRALAGELEAKVRERTSELLQANEQLQGFTYSVAHDLRQQIRGISINASILLQDAAQQLDEESQHHLTRLASSAKQLSALVDDLLQYAKLGRQEPRRVEVDLSAVAHEVASGLLASGSFAPAPAVEVQPGMKVTGDPSMIGIAMQNLLDNAFKYSSNSPAPRVRVGHDERGYYVEDNGIGFDMSYADKVFEPFERLHAAHEYTGTGIGLANVKRIIEKHGGKIWVESVPGQGTRFQFTVNGVR